MKKILLVGKSFNIGGIQSSMINLIQVLKGKYQIDVLVYSNDGPLKKHLPPDINFIQGGYLLNLFGQAQKDLLRKHRYIDFFVRFLFGIWTKIFNNDFPLALAFRQVNINKEYDVAIAYHHEDKKTTLVSGFYRLIINRIKAKRKYGWIHYVPGTISFNDKFIEPYCKQLDGIVCVSKSLAEIFKEKHPHIASKVLSCYNFVNTEEIKFKSNNDTNIIVDKSCFNLISACRFDPVKGLPRAINAIADLFVKYPTLRWYIAGDGIERPAVTELIKKNKLEDKIILLGTLSNPYPYIKQADLYFQVSISEAAPMVYGEAKSLHIPIFTTRTTSADELVGNKWGIVCNNTSEGIHDSLDKLLTSDRYQLLHDMIHKLDYDVNTESILFFEKIVS